MKGQRKFRNYMVRTTGRCRHATTCMHIGWQVASLKPDCIIQSSGREQQGQMYEHSIQWLHPWGTACCSALLIEGVKPAEIHHWKSGQYGACTMSQQEVYEWVEHFEAWRAKVQSAWRWSLISFTPHRRTRPEGGWPWSGKMCTNHKQQQSWASPMDLHKP